MWGHMSTTDLPGSSLLAGRYRLVERLGAGGMSVVWRGFDEVLGRQVAVKVLPPSTSVDPSFRRRLRAEAQAAARLSHPHITNVYDYGEATTVDGEPVPYVVMELVDGKSLAAVLARVGRLPWPDAVRITAEVSAALAAAHSRGIVHRDVTPANVMLTSAGAKVVDFGISALIGENDIDPDGSLLGTPAYLAPERLEGGQVSPATDVYAVGLLIYRTLIGQLPWDVGTTTALLRAHQYMEPEPLPYVEGLPSAVAALVGRCLEKRPEDRPSSAELAHVLAGVSAGAPAAHGYVPDWADAGEDTTILPSQHRNTDGLGRIRAGHAKVPSAPPAQAGRGVAAVPGGVAAVPGGVAAVPGRVAAVPGGGREAAAAAAVAAAAVRRSPTDAPISPAPGAAVPVPVSDVQAALDGSRVSDVARSASGPAAGLAANVASGRAAGAASGLAAAAASGSAAAPVPAHAPPPAGGRAPAHGAGARNSRFAATPRSAAASAAAPGAASAPAAQASAPGSAAAPGVASASAGPASMPGSAAAPASGSVPTSGPASVRHAVGPDDQPAAATQRHAGGGTPPPDKNRPDGAGSGGPGRNRPGGTQGRRVLVTAGAVVLLTVGVYAWSLSVGRENTSANRRTGPTVLAAEGKCVVSYAVWKDFGGRFQAQLTVANRDEAAISNWSLWFIMNGDQVVSGNLRGAKDQPITAPNVWLDQRGKEVTVTSADTLNAQKTATVQVNGRYTASNAAPLAFKLNGKTCETFVSGKPDAPSRPVEHLSDGTVRLGPIPTTSTPAPGVTIDANGIAHVTPTTKPPTGPTRTTAPATTGTTPPTAPTTTVPPPPPTTTDPVTTTLPTTDPTPPTMPPTDGGDPVDTGGSPPAPLPT
jgi:eukaryotic-like serine/threonine-protein kinase